MICVACGEQTTVEPCSVCSSSPLLDGRYQLEEQLGEGSVGTVFRGHRVADGLVVCVKEIVLARSTTQKARELARREAQILCELQHGSIPRWHDDFLTSEGRSRTLWIVEDFVDGEDLQRRMAHHRYEADEVVTVLRELLEVLTYLHGLSPPVIHRDLKPANVVRREDGSHALVDFGSVRDVLRDPAVGGSTVTGTFGYMAPEQFAGDAVPATDLYGLGALAIALLTRKEPRNLLQPDRRLDWRRSCKVRPALAAWIDRMVAPNVEDRFVDAQQALQDLEAARQPTPLVLRPIERSRPSYVVTEHDKTSQWLSPLLVRMHKMRDEDDLGDERFIRWGYRPTPHRGEDVGPLGGLSEVAAWVGLLAAALLALAVITYALFTLLFG